MWDGNWESVGKNDTDLATKGMMTAIQIGFDKFEGRNRSMTKRGTL